MNTNQQSSADELLPPLLENPLDRIDFLLSQGKPRVMVGLAGLPGSGKSTLATKLTGEVNAAFGEGTMITIGMDGFHLTKAELALMPDPVAALRRRGAPWTFDPVAMAVRLLQVKQSAGVSAVRWPDFQHGAGDPVADAIEVAPATRCVLVEGLYVVQRSEGWENVSRQFDESWFLDTPLDVSLERLTLRHMASRGIDRAEAERRIEVNDRLNALLTLETRQLSDWRVH